MRKDAKQVMKKGNRNHPKNMVTVKRNIQAQFQDKIKENAQYHKEAAMEWSKKQDWEEWQDVFQEKRKSVFLYSDIEKFAYVKSKGNQKIERWIMKSIGPKPMKEIVWQGDWALERAYNLSKDSRMVEALELKMKSDDAVLKITAPIAQSYESWQDDMSRVRMAVLDYLGGSILEEKPEKFKKQKDRERWEQRQEYRLQFYQGWMEKLLHHKTTIDNQYLKALGMDSVQRNSVIFQKMMIALGNNVKGVLPAVAGENGNIDPTEIWKQAITMEVSKARAFDMPLPDEYNPVVKELERTKVIDVTPKREK